MLSLSMPGACGDASNEPEVHPRCGPLGVPPPPPLLPMDTYMHVNGPGSFRPEVLGQKEQWLPFPPTGLLGKQT